MVRTYDVQEAGGLKVLCVAGVCPGIIHSAVADEQCTLASIDQYVVLLALTDLLSVLQPLNHGVLPGHLTL